MRMAGEEMETRTEVEALSNVTRFRDWNEWVVVTVELGDTSTT